MRIYFLNLHDCLPTHWLIGKKIVIDTYLKKKERNELVKLHLKSTIYIAIIIYHYEKFWDNYTVHSNYTIYILFIYHLFIFKDSNEQLAGY